MDLTGEPGLLRWFRGTKRVLDWSFFARPGGTFVRPRDSGQGVTIVDQRTLYYLQAAGALTAGPDDLVLVSSSALAQQEDLLPLWEREGVLGARALTATYVVEDLGPLDESLAGDTALALSHALRHGQPVPVTQAGRWLAGRRDELAVEEFLALLDGRAYTSPLRGLAHGELERRGVSVAVRHSVTDSFERAALYQSGSLTPAARRMLPAGYLAWTAEEAVGAARELLRQAVRVYIKADGIGSSAVAVAETTRDATRRVGELWRGCQLSTAIGAGQETRAASRFPAPMEIAPDVTAGQRPLRHFTVQVLIAGPAGEPRVELLNASAKEPAIAFGSRPLDRLGQDALRLAAPQLAEVALAAAPAGCELLSLEGFLLGDGEPEVRLIEANLRLAGMSQLLLAARAASGALGPSCSGDYLVGNVAVAPGESNGEVLLRLRAMADARGRRVLMLGRERPDSAKIVVLAGEQPPGPCRELFGAAAR
ncbi:MAG TPA: hypothetical protein VGG25_22245 [Streptosporangiaceae bacterium]